MDQRLAALIDGNAPAVEITVEDDEVGVVRQGGFLGAALFHFLVQAVHHIGYPTDAGFKIGDVELGKTLKDPADDRGNHRHHLLGRMIDGVG